MNKFSGDLLQKVSKAYLFIGAYNPDYLPGQCLALYIFKISSVAGKLGSNMECFASRFEGKAQSWELVVALTLSLVFGSFLHLPEPETRVFLFIIFFSL